MMMIIIINYTYKTIYTLSIDTNIIQSSILNNKPPPLLTKRIPGPISFPIPFVLEYKQDVTPEGLVYPQGWSNNKKIVVTVRLDTDGIAATRDSTDLIGKSIAEPSSSDGEKGLWNPVEVELTDRGIGGKFVTRKK